MTLLLLIACHPEPDAGDSSIEDTATDPPVVTGPCDSWTGLVVGRTHTYDLEGPGYRATNASTVLSIDDDGTVARTAAVSGVGGVSGDTPYTADVVETAHCDDQGYWMSERAVAYDDGSTIDTTYDPALVWFWSAVELGRQWKQDSRVTVDDSLYGTDAYDLVATVEVTGEDTIATPAGTFLAYRIDYYDGPTELKTDWMVEGIGRVLQVSYDPEYGDPQSWITLTSVTDE